MFGGSPGCACCFSCIANFIDHALLMKADLLGDLVHDDVRDGLHGRNRINCGNLKATVVSLLQTTASSNLISTVLEK